MEVANIPNFALIRRCNFISRYFIYAREEFVIMTHDDANHANHLCAVHKANGVSEAYKALVKDGKYVCKGCGRVAADEKSLCAPEPL